MGKSYLKSKFYPIDSMRKLIYDDPQAHERDCSNGTRYALFVTGTIGARGAWLNQTERIQTQYEVLPASFVDEWDKTRRGFEYRKGRERGHGYWRIEQNPATTRWRWVCYRSFLLASEVDGASQYDYTTVKEAAAACVAAYDHRYESEGST